MHKSYVSKLRFAATLGAAMLLAACSESSDQGDAQDAAQTADPAAQTEAVDVASKTEGTWGDLVYGDPNAPVTIIEYASLTCPHCARFAVETFPKVKEQFLDTGKAKLVYRNFIMNRVDIAASAAARCGNDETTKKLMKVFFARQYDWARAESPLDELASLARRAGISRTQFDRCVSNEDMLKHLMQMTMDGQKEYDINSTPSFIVNGKQLEFRTHEEILEGIAAAVN